VALSLPQYGICNPATGLSRATFDRTAGIHRTEALKNNQK
jgi:hypothetical protein